MPQIVRSLPRIRPTRVAAVAAVLLATAPASASLARTVDGNPGPNRLSGSAGPDIIHGGGGADRVTGGGGADRLFGETGPTTSVVARATT